MPAGTSRARRSRGSCRRRLPRSRCEDRPGPLRNRRAGNHRMWELFAALLRHGAADDPQHPAHHERHKADRPSWRDRLRRARRARERHRRSGLPVADAQILGSGRRGAGSSLQTDRRVVVAVVRNGLPRLAPRQGDAHRTTRTRLAFAQDTAAQLPVQRRRPAIAVALIGDDESYRRWPTCDSPSHLRRPAGSRAGSPWPVARSARWWIVNRTAAASRRRWPSLTLGDRNAEAPPSPGDRGACAQ